MSDTLEAWFVREILAHEEGLVRPELVTTLVEMKRGSPRFGCRRIAQQIALLFGAEIDKDVLRRVLAKRCRPTGGSDCPSWLRFLGHAKDSLWSVDPFRCESLILKSH